MFQEILKDSSAGKQTSHGRLRNFIDKHGEKGLMTYRRNELVALCEAYQVRFNSRATKGVLTNLLMQAVRVSNCIPEPLFVDDRYTVQTIRSANDGDQRIVLRFTNNMPMTAN